MNKSLAAVGASVAVVLGSLIAATPANAAANPGIVHFDTTFNGGWQCTVSSASVRANPGDSLTLSWSSIQSTSAGFVLDGPTGQLVVPISTSAPSTVSLPVLGTYRMNPGASFGCALTVSVVAEPVAPPPAHDYFQQVGVPASDNCADVSPTVGHWSGFPIGGWSKSWAAWINNGRGGAVCTREIEERPDGTILLIG